MAGHKRFDDRARPFLASGALQPLLRARGPFDSRNRVADARETKSESEQESTIRAGLNY
jgi:hypothetical protein